MQKKRARGAKKPSPILQQCAVEGCGKALREKLKVAEADAVQAASRVRLLWPARLPRTQGERRPRPARYTTTTPIALRSADAAAMLGISESLLETLVRNGRLRGPVHIPGHRIARYDFEYLRADWEALREEAEATNPWDIQ